MINSDKIGCLVPASYLVGSTGQHTPWCDMLGLDGCDVLHVWHLLADIQIEVEKFTTKLGALRRTEEAKHLQELISMTEDETPYFVSYLETVAAEIFDKMVAYTTSVSFAYNFDEGHETVEIDPDGTDVVDYYMGDWVKIGDKLYVATEDGDSTDLSPLIEQDVDFRHSVHYIIEQPSYVNTNSVNPLDVAVKDALVWGVIYRWLDMAYPDEAEKYLAKYEVAKDQVASRCHVLKNTGKLVVPSRFA